MKRVLFIAAVVGSFAATLVLAGAPDSKGEHSLPLIARAGKTPARHPIGVLVESFPSGVLIQVNHHVWGRTPCRVLLDGGSNSFNDITLIKAFPERIGQYVQTKVFAAGDPIPRRLRFDMRLFPPDPAVDVYFN
jgi:hypothetical protein